MVISCLVQMVNLFPVILAWKIDLQNDYQLEGK